MPCAGTEAEAGSELHVCVYACMYVRMCAVGDERKLDLRPVVE